MGEMTSAVAIEIVFLVIHSVGDFENMIKNYEKFRCCVPHGYSNVELFVIQVANDNYNVCNILKFRNGKCL